MVTVAAALVMTVTFAGEAKKTSAAFGVRSYWLLDPQLRSLEVLELGPDGRYVHAAAATSGVLRERPSCPGLVIDLDALWAELDRLGPEP